ncbi:MAG: 50S ribosomal protein L13 [Candidatus Zixiibacteriota bacterium]
MKTIVPKIEPKDRRWYLVDLEGITMGHAAVQVANLLRGKEKPIFTPHIDTGDNVIAVNASGLRFSGKKLSQKTYYHYSGYPGGLKKVVLGKAMSQRPDRVFWIAVKHMLPQNRLGRKQIGKLHVYAGAEHPHSAQKPVKVKLSN